MPDSYRLKICYLLVQPYRPPNHYSASPVIPLLKDAPYFYELDIEYRSLKVTKRVIDGVEIQIHVQILNDEAWVAECQYPSQGLLYETTAQQKQTVNSALRQLLLEETGYKGTLVEEYTILLISEFQSSPDDFVQSYGATLAQLIRASDRGLNSNQIEQVLLSRTRYGTDDLSIVDWEGAVILSKAADFRTEIDLLTIGNYQLLKYRIVDEQIDQQLQQLRNLLDSPISWFSNRREMLSKIVERRLGLLLDFEKTDQSLLLIGDWYSVQLYRIIFDEFYIDEWKAIVRNKLENLSSIAEVIQQNLTFSWSRLFDILQLVGWLLLLLGYFFLFMKDANIIH